MNSKIEIKVDDQLLMKRSKLEVGTIFVYEYNPTEMRIVPAEIFTKVININGKEVILSGESAGMLGNINNNANVIVLDIYAKRKGNEYVMIPITKLAT